jgi:predicted RNase H-like nuclease (RuvC/YqgF family)
MDIVERLRDAGDHASFDPQLHHKAADEIERLQNDLKMAIMSDTKYCKTIENDNKRLRKREGLIATLDRKIEEQDYEIYQLREALKDIAYMNPLEADASHMMQAAAFYAI